MRWTIRMCLAALSCAAVAPTASAAGIAGVDVMTSTVIQEKQSSFSGLGLRMRIASPRLIQGVELMPTVEYWRNANNVEPFGIRTTRKDATLGADIRYAFRSTGTRPYIGGGIALHFLSSSVDAPSPSRACVADCSCASSAREACTASATSRTAPTSAWS